MADNIVFQQEDKSEKTAKFVNPILAWGLILGEMAIAAVIAAIVLLPLM